MDQQLISEEHKTDGQGNPAGGISYATGILIEWQNGPLGRGDLRKGINGAFVEGVLNACIGRLRFYQDSKFKCEENDMALAHLYSAKAALQKRTDERESRGVEGTHNV